MKTLFTATMVTVGLLAATASWAGDGEQAPAPRLRPTHVIPTQDEIANPHLYHPQYDYGIYTPPPSLGPPPEVAVTRPGEFEEMDATLIAPANYGAEFIDMFVDMVYAFAFGGHTIIIIDEPLRTLIEPKLVVEGIPSSAYSWLYYPRDAIWTRDYGPEFVVEEDGTRHIIDAKYHSDRPKDDAIPIWIGASDWINTDGSPMEVHSHDHGLNGGNISTDGAGTCFFTDIIYSYEKPSGWTNDDVDTLMTDYYGCEQIIALKPICNDGTGHIDLYFKNMGPNAVLLGEFPPDTYFDGTQNAGGGGHCGDTTPNDYQDQEDNLATIEATTNMASDDWIVTRMPMPEPYQDSYGWVYRSYMNSEIFNNIVAMPVYYEVQEGETIDELLDMQALATEAYETAAPGVEVFPIDSDHIIPLAGAIHCVAHEIVPDPAGDWSLPAEYCGDGTINGDEECDGPDFGEVDCSDYGFNAGSLLCDMNCEIDPSECENDTASDTDVDSDTDADSDADTDADAGPTDDGDDDDGCGCNAAGRQLTPSLLQLILG